MNILKRKHMDVLKNKLKDPFAEMDLPGSTYYPTGFDELDYRNGCKVVVTDMNTKENITEYFKVGIPGGTCNAFIGPSGSGKTAMAIQAGKHIAASVPGGLLIHEDAEQATDLSRVIKITGGDKEWLKENYIYRNVGVNTEDFFNRIKAHVEMKIENKDELTYDTGKLDEFGQPQKELVPTVWILDSLANLMPSKNLDEEGTGTNMTAAQIAKANSNIFKKLIPLLAAGNVILFIINHIGVAISVSMYEQPKKQVNFLKQGENIPGGNTVIFLCNNIFKLEAKAAYKADDKYKIEGFPTNLTIIKSRTNKAGQLFELIFSNGAFSQIMSKFHMAKTHEIIKGAAYLEMEGYPTKFRNSNFVEKYMSEPEFRQAFNKACEPLLQKFAMPENNSAISQEAWIDILQKDIQLPDGVSIDELIK